MSSHSLSRTVMLFPISLWLLILFTLFSTFHWFSLKIYTVFHLLLVIKNLYYPTPIPHALFHCFLRLFTLSLTSHLLPRIFTSNHTHCLSRIFTPILSPELVVKDIYCLLRLFTLFPISECQKYLYYFPTPTSCQYCLLCCQCPFGFQGKKIHYFPLLLLFNTSLFPILHWLSGLFTLFPSQTGCQDNLH